MAPHCELGPDECFGCKVRYWRENGGVAVGYRYGRKDFHETTIREKRDQAVREARENGIEPVPVGTRWV